mgnify:CR=1 FL=1
MTEETNVYENKKKKWSGQCTAQKEDGAYLSMAEDIIPTILEAQSAEVDTISGATFSSGGILDAVKAALSSAKN